MTLCKFKNYKQVFLSKPLNYRLEDKYFPFKSIDMRFRANITEKSEVEGKKGLQFVYFCEVYGRLKK